MGITVGFLVKHVRPVGDGFNAYCSQDLIRVLFSLNFTAAEVIGILADWYQVSQANPMNQSNRFVAAAKAVARARWGELYPTDMSTVMFLNQAQLASLSLAGTNAGPNQRFAWNYGADLPICVTINRQTDAHHVRWNATGCTADTDHNGNVTHFGSMT